MLLLKSTPHSTQRPKPALAHVEHTGHGSRAPSTAPDIQTKQIRTYERIRNELNSDATVSLRQV